MTEQHEVEALVVGGVDYGEADRVVYLLARDGRFAVFAHGAKTSKRRFQGALEPFTTIRASVSQSKKRRTGMLTLANAIVEAARLPLRRDLKTIALASYVAELSSKVAPEGQPSAGIFELARDVLDYLCRSDPTMAARRAFELRLIAVIGYRPELQYCVECGGRQDVGHLARAGASARGRPPARSFFDLNRGGILCDEHRQNAREIGPNTIAWMRAVLASDVFSIEGADLDAEGRDRAARKLTGPLAEFFAQLLDRAPSSLALLEAERL